METTSQSPITPEIYSAFVGKLYNRSDDPSKDFCHAILGIATEIHELQNATDEVNAIEELGDLYFYLEALRQVIQDFRGPVDDFDVVPGLDYLVKLSESLGTKQTIAVTVNTLLDDAKRWVGYGKTPKSLPEVLRTCTEVVLFTGARCEHLPPGAYSHQKVLRANMAKLLKRYPGGEFSAFHAVVRDVEAERGVLQAAQ